MTKPFKTFLVLFSVLLLLLGLAWVNPADGFRVGNFKLRYPSWSKLQTLFFDSYNKPVSQNFNLAKNNITDSVALPRSYSADSIQIRDTVFIDTLTSNEKPRTVSPDFLKSRIVPIEFNDDNISPLNSFFRSLSNGGANSEQIRVMHFGDSQIEGDRITMFIRSAFQQKFGGNGVGVIPGYPQSYQPLNVKHSVSGDWRYTSLLDGGIEVSQFGLLGGITKIEDGSSGESIEFKKVGKGLSGNKFRKLKVFYGQNDSTYVMELIVNSNVFDAEILPSNNGVASHTFTVPFDATEISLSFMGKGPFTVYGVSMESDRGVYVDNIPQRGSSGAVFTKFDKEFAAKIFNSLNVKLVILQYGVNVVPGNLDSYKYYEDILYRQIKAIKSFKPDVSVVLIGVSDMSTKIDGEFVSYPNIEKVRNAQRNAAFRAGAAFWDCYEAMGGVNSMPDWVYADPPLATKDFTHFNFRGSKLIAEMFTVSLFDEYRKFEEQKINE